MPVATPNSICFVCQKKSQEFTISIEQGGMVSVCNSCLRPSIYFAWALCDGLDVRVSPDYGPEVCSSFDAEEA